MKKQKRRKIKTKVKMPKFIFLLTVIFIIASCNKSENYGRNAEPINIAYSTSIESEILTKVCAEILTDMGYETNIRLMSEDSVFLSLYNFTNDLYLGMQLPWTHKSRWENYSDSLEVLGTSYQNISNGLVVPIYVNINAITQLNHNATKFDSIIYVDKQSTLLKYTTKNVLQKYLLDFKLVECSIEELDSIVDTCNAVHKWVLFTGTKPHVFWKKYQHKYLNDHLGLFPKEHLEIVAHNKFRVQYPIVSKFLSKYTFPEEKLETLMFELSLLEQEQHSEFIEEWYKKNKHMFEMCYPDEWRE